MAIHVADLPELLMKWTEAIAQEKDLEEKMRIRGHDGSFDGIWCEQFRSAMRTIES